VRVAFALVAAAAGVLLVRRRYEELLRQLEESRMRIARAADLERSRIERDLHDGAQQRLIGLRIKLSIAEEREDPSAALRELGAEVELALEELRQLAHGVYPPLLSDRGLADALRALALELPLPVNLAVADLERRPPEVETAVYFACREAAQNALKHGAGELWIALTEHGFEVRDDGPGFTPPTGAFNGGLRNMRDRIEAVGGRLTIDSAPGTGTRVRGVV
jgi:signal transduction histidine kinase